MFGIFDFKQHRLVNYLRRLDKQKRMIAFYRALSADEREGYTGKQLLKLLTKNDKALSKTAAKYEKFRNR